MNTHVIIYSLSDPNTLEVRYVGVTKKNPKLRLTEHIYESRIGTKTHKCNWIRKLLKKDSLPILEMVDYVPLEEWDFWEQHWISQFKQWGFSLTNGTLGGGGRLGNAGWKHTAKTKERIRKGNSGVNNYNYGKTLTDEWKKKISDSVRGEKNGFYGKKHSEKTLSKRRIRILQYTEFGDFIKEWKSIADAISETGIRDICWACSGKHHTAGGFQWKKMKKGYPLKIPAAKPYKKKVAQIDIDTQQIVKIWNSAREAQRTLRLNHISKVCLGYKSHKTIGGYKWKFVDHIS